MNKNLKNLVIGIAVSASLLSFAGCASTVDVSNTKPVTQYEQTLSKTFTGANLESSQYRYDDKDGSLNVLLNFDTAMDTNGALNQLKKTTVNSLHKSLNGNDDVVKDITLQVKVKDSGNTYQYQYKDGKWNK